MKTEQERLIDQSRWNQVGVERIRQIERNPDKHIISDSPILCSTPYAELMGMLNPMKGKRILELGCGRGDLSIWLAKQGARVTAIDLGPDLVAAAQALGKINQVDCEFRVGNITELPFESATYDVVIGLAILHHLTEAEVMKSIRECHRVLRPDGIVIFHEPVENSALFNFVQNLFPAGEKGSHYYRPSILRRRAWARYLEALDDRTMTNRELIAAGAGLFRTTRLSPYGFLIRLVRLVGNRHRNSLLRLDRFLFQIFPPLRRYSQAVLVEYRK